MGESLRAFAKRMHVTEGAIRKAIAAGRILVEPDGTIDIAQASAYTASRDPSSINTGTKGTANTNGNAVAQNFQTARAVREAFEARIAELNYRQRVGALVEASDIELAAYDLGRRIRDLLQSVAPRLAPVVAGLAGEQAACFAAIQAEMDNVCDELSAKRRTKKGAAA
jgi:hypothetical protein